MYPSCNTQPTCSTPTTSPIGCEWIPDWQDPNNCTCKHDGYSKTDGCFKFTERYGDKCTILIGKSRTTEKNKDHPMEGSRKNPATWEVGTLCYWLSKEDNADLTPYPVVTAGDNVIVDSSTNPTTGQVTYTVNARETGGASDGVVTGVVITGNTNVQLTRSNSLPNVSLPCYTTYSAFVNSSQNPGQTTAGDLPSTVAMVTNDASQVVFAPTAFGTIVKQTGYYQLDHFSQFSYLGGRTYPSPTDQTARHDVYALKPDGTQVILNTILQNPDWENDTAIANDLFPQTYPNLVYIEAGWEIRQKIGKLTGGNLDGVYLDARRNRFRLTSSRVYPIACPN